MKLLVAFLSLLALSALPAPAHQDTRLKFEDGKIIGLPEKYQPAAFDLKRQALTLSGKEMPFPPALRRLLTRKIESDDPFDDAAPPETEPLPYSYSFAASWYHEMVLSGLPPYLLVTIRPEEGEARFELLIDMDKRALLRAEVVTKGLGVVPIDLGEKKGIPGKGNIRIPAGSDEPFDFRGEPGFDDPEYRKLFACQTYGELRDQLEKAIASIDPGDAGEWEDAAQMNLAATCRLALIRTHYLLMETEEADTLLWKLHPAENEPAPEEPKTQVCRVVCRSAEKPPR